MHALIQMGYNDQEADFIISEFPEDHISAYGEGVTPDEIAKDLAGKVMGKLKESL